MLFPRCGTYINTLLRVAEVTAQYRTQRQTLDRADLNVSLRSNREGLYIIYILARTHVGDRRHVSRVATYGEGNNLTGLIVRRAQGRRAENTVPNLAVTLVVVLPHTVNIHTILDPILRREVHLGADRVARQLIVGQYLH